MQIRTTTDREVRSRSHRRLRPEGAAPSAVSGEVSGFQEILNTVLPAQQEETRDLHRLWSALPAAERSLIENPSAENLKTYRELVRSIAREILKSNMRVTKLRRKVRGNDVELNVLEIIDDRLHRMMMALQSKSNTGFQILRNLDEIRGLLMDLRG
jgi:uncharacterized protein YaaR (DUF327 family)